MYFTRKHQPHLTGCNFGPSYLYVMSLVSPRAKFLPFLASDQQSSKTKIYLLFFNLKNDISYQHLLDLNHK